MKQIIKDTAEYNKDEELEEEIERIEKQGLIKKVGDRWFRKHISLRAELKGRQEARREVIEEVEKMIDEKYYLPERKLGKGTGSFWEKFKQHLQELKSQETKSEILDRCKDKIVADSSPDTKLKDIKSTK